MLRAPYSVRLGHQLLRAACTCQCFAPALSLLDGPYCLCKVEMQTMLSCRPCILGRCCLYVHNGSRLEKELRCASPVDPAFRE